MKQPINLRQIEAFRAVMLTGTMTGAAEMLFVSQPSISRLISDLEKRFHIQLFVRRHGRLLPTSEAEALYQETERLFGGLNRLAGFLQQITVLKRGHLRILATSPMAYGLLPSVFQRMQRDHPGVTFALKIIARRYIRNWIEAQQFDLGLITFPVEYPTQDSHFFTKVKGVCVLPSQHPLQNRKIVDVTDLADQKFILPPAESATRHNIDQVFDRANVHRNLTIETHSALSICEMVSTGLGVSVVDPFTAHRYKDRGIIIRRFRQTVPYEFGIIYPFQRPRSRLAETLAGYARENAAEMARDFKKI